MYSVGIKEASSEIYQCWGSGRVAEKGIIEVRLELNLYVLVFMNPMLKNKFQDHVPGAGRAGYKNDKPNKYSLALVLI